MGLRVFIAIQIPFRGFFLDFTEGKRLVASRTIIKDRLEHIFV
jgi:hypothetical protein